MSKEKKTKPDEGYVPQKPTETPAPPQNFTSAIEPPVDPELAQLRATLAEMRQERETMVSEMAALKAVAAPSPEPAPKGTSGKRRFLVLVRHSQLPIKRAEVEAGDEVEAFHAFCGLNRTKAQQLAVDLASKRRDIQHPAPGHVEKFIQEREQHNIEIVPA